MTEKLTVAERRRRARRRVITLRVRDETVEAIDSVLESRIGWVMETLGKSRVDAEDLVSQAEVLREALMIGLEHLARARE